MGPKLGKQLWQTSFAKGRFLSFESHDLVTIPDAHDAAVQDYELSKLH